MDYKITQEGGNITCRSKTTLDGKRCSIKIILGTKEENIIKEFIKSINTISKMEKIYPNIFTFDRRSYMSFILSRVVKYYDDVRAEGLPLNKWEIEDIKDKFGNFNNESTMFSYFGLSEVYNKNFFLKEMSKDKKELMNFFVQSSNKIYNLSLITSRILDNTYSNKIGPNIVVSLEIEPIKDKISEFKETFPYYKDEDDENILRLMKNNFAFSRLLGVSICKLTDKKIETEEQRRITN